MATQINPDEVVDFDEPLNTSPDFSSTHVFSTDDIAGTFGGLTQGDLLPGDTPIINFSGDPLTTQDGVELFPINSEFGFVVSDFEGALEKDFDANPEYAEGFAGDLKNDVGEQIGLVVSDAPTDTFKTPATFGTWLAGIGGNTVKASTEHYVVMQNVLSDQRYPDDPDALYALDDNLRMVGGEYDGQFVADILDEVGDRNGDGATDLKDVLEPNESTITENIAVGDDYSVTMKDDGKLLYRWGNTVKRPNDVRIEAELPLPDEWKAADDGPLPLFRVTSAELVVHHTITNNPNDQIRPEDYENESAIGTLPTYVELPDGRWVTTDDYYAGDGTLYPAGTVLKDPALAELVEGSTIDRIGATSGDLTEGFTNAWYTTMDREPFEPVLNEDGTEYVTGPRWRLLPGKYGQDLPSVDITVDPSKAPPAKKDDIKYEVGAETQTVINLLDWEFPASPLGISAGWLHDSGTVTENGLNLTENFDVAFYIKGDVKPATIYSAELLVDYEAVEIFATGAAVTGAEGDDYLVGEGGNTFTGADGEDVFVVGYGADTPATDGVSRITDFTAGADTIAFIDHDVNDFVFDSLVSQSIDAEGLVISLDGTEAIRLDGVSAFLSEDDFLVLNPHRGTLSADAVLGAESSERMAGTAASDLMLGLGGDDRMVGNDGDDELHGGDGFDTIRGGGGDDMLYGAVADDLLIGNAGGDRLLGGAGDDMMRGGLGGDMLHGGQGFDTASYRFSSEGVEVNLKTGEMSKGDAEGDEIFDVEALIGSRHDDALYGSNDANMLSGKAGDDLLVGRRGDDLLEGGKGDDRLAGRGGSDTLVGGAGGDRLSGGVGRDFVDYVESTAGVTVNLRTGLGSGGHADGDRLISIERVKGSLFDDALTGDARGNWLNGRIGNDVLSGEGGRDLIRGGLGNDQMTGGAGADTFKFTAARFGKDVITDWQDGVDTLDLSELGLGFEDLTATQSGADAVLEFGAGQVVTLLNTDIADIDVFDFA